MRRLNLFVKGNVDLRDSLLYSQVNGSIQWNGINEIVRQQFPSSVVRIRHETWTRSDALLEAADMVPADLQERSLPLGPYPADSQFSRKVLTTPSHVVVLSIQPDVTTSLLRHRSKGYLIYPNNWHTWSPEDRR